MAIVAVQAAMTLETSKTVHPFFSKPLRNDTNGHAATVAEDETENSNNDLDYEQGTAGAHDPKKKRNRRSGDQKMKEKGSRAKNQPSLESFTNKASRQATPDACTPSEDIPDGEDLADDDVEAHRRKRRKTTPPMAQDGAVQDVQSTMDLDWYQQLQLAAGEIAIQDVGQNAEDQEVLAQAAIYARSGTIEQPNSAFSIPPTTSTNPTEAVLNKPEDSPPRRILKITNGRLVSPSASKPTPAATASPKKRRGRKKLSERPPSTITVIRYGSDSATRLEIGEKIEAILKSPKRRKRGKPTPPKPAPQKSTELTGSPKSTHPFFLGKSASKKDDVVSAVDVPPAPPAISCSPFRGPRKAAVTPGKLLRTVQDQVVTQPMPAFGPIAGDPRAPKYPGMCEPLWPNSENAHVRNVDDDEPHITFDAEMACPSKKKKLKGGISTVTATENIINRLSSELEPLNHAPIEENYGYHAHPPSMRVPGRLLTTGVKIQQLVRKELSSTLRHPALISLFDRIEHTLTPFDKGECEKQSWINKYAPSCASHVLQTGKEAAVLRDWLQNLTVMAVQSRTEGGKMVTSSESKKPTKKRRKKNEDDFIVYDFEISEDEDMVELSDAEDFGERPNGRNRLRSLKHSKTSRNNNIVLMSGPHGCGKSAAVYAVAKELGFEVFEINSGSRRSGKDIQDKVGSMSENHLVSQQKAPAAVPQEQVSTDKTEDDRMSKALQDDLDSGRQGTMMSFFKPKTPSALPKPHPKPKPASTTKHPSPSFPSAQATLLPTKSQKQSLILLEEADVLFEEDQQFWAQIIKLASQSKRPIVITCNDESKIPLYDLPLGAILRLAPPPINLATDYMLTLAAHEGHLLKRAAVQDLFQSKNYDLRASITELDFWCQMSVGDRKGGLEWMYQRWPPGQDVDESGRILRVASQDTYQSSMGWLSNDVSMSSGNTGFDEEEELHKEAWTEWGIDPLTWIGLNIPSPASTSPITPGYTQSLDNLKQLDSLLESVSAADIYCNVGLPSYQRLYGEPIDPTLPPITEKERDNYTADLPVLECSQKTDFGMFDTSILIQVHKINRRLYGPDASGFICGPTIENHTPGLARAILDSRTLKSKDISRSRSDFSLAFDDLAVSANTNYLSSGPHNLVASSFDRTFRIIVEDLGPYVRAIVSHELRLEAERLRLSNLLSEGGRSKRARTTRASRVALEGGTRESKRRETWFNGDLNRVLVMCTAGEEWTGLGAMADESDTTSRIGATESVTSTPEQMTGVHYDGLSGLGGHE